MKSSPRSSLTAQLYFGGPYCMEFTAQVEEVVNLPDNQYAAILPSTYFYPTSGGQENDTGNIGEAAVTNVYIADDGRIYHALDRKILPGKHHARIDKNRRIRSMQHHTAQHILSACFTNLLSIATLSANINGSTPSTIDLDVDRISDDSLNRIEDLANSIVFENREVKSYSIPYEEITNIPLRKPPQIKGDTRVVEVSGLDYSSCCGTHCQYTGSVGVIKIMKHERMRGNIRVHFIAGYQALDIFRSRFASIQDTAKYLGVHPDGIFQGVVSIAEKLREKEQRLKFYQNEYIRLVADGLFHDSDTYHGKKVLTKLFQDASVSDLREIGLLLCRRDGILAALGAMTEKRLSLVIACGSSIGIDARDVLKIILSQCDGKGGGDSMIAQGGCDNLNWSTLDLKKVIERIIDEKSNG